MVPVIITGLVLALFALAWFMTKDPREALSILPAEVYAAPIIVFLIWWLYRYESLRPAFQVTMAWVVAISLYIFIRNGHGQGQYKGTPHFRAPLWLSLICGRPDERLSSVAVAQPAVIFGAVGYTVGMIWDGTTGAPALALVGSVAVFVLVTVLWLLWGLWRWVFIR
jgi:hypothetical protein